MRRGPRLYLAWLAGVFAWTSCGHETLLARAPGQPWQAPLAHDHALAGKIWDVANGCFLTPERFIDYASQSRFLLLGEKHDNPDHHRIQAWIVRALVAAGREPAVAFEMFSPEQGPAIQGHLVSHPGDVEGFAEAVDWDQSGWPDFAIYRPVVEAVLEARLRVHPANLSRDELKALRKEGIAGLEPAFVTRFGLDRPLPPPQYAGLAEEIQEAHCGHAPESRIKAMVVTQRARDASMAKSLLDGVGTDGIVLIAGAAHARRDQGVPAYLILEEPDAQIASVGLVEVQLDRDNPLDYSSETLAGLFDYLWFTPRVDDLDPCEKYRDQLEKFRKKAEPTP